MLFEDTYHMPTNTSEGLYKEKGSKFIAYAFPVFSEEDVKERLEEIRKKNTQQGIIAMHTPYIQINQLGVPMMMASLLTQPENQY